MEVIDRARGIRQVGLFGLAWLALLLHAPVEAAVLGVMGDSLSDEYAEESYGAYAESWVEQLVLHASVDAGPTASEAGAPGGSFGEPRRTGYGQNWARSGATSESLLSGGQHTGLAVQVSSDGIQYSVLAIGANDFHPSGATYQGIYAGTWSTTQIDAYVSQRLVNIELALDPVLAIGSRLLLVNVPDYGVTPTVRGFFPDSAGRQAVSDVIAQVNAGLETIAQVRGLVLFDIYESSIAIFGAHVSPRTTLLLGNVAIDLAASDTAGGGNPTAAFVHDGVHPNTTLQGIIAASVAEALNIGYDAGIPVFTEEQILAHRGLAYGGSDTLVSQLGTSADYIHSYVQPLAVPTLPPWGIALLAAGLLLSLRPRLAD